MTLDESKGQGKSKVLLSYRWPVIREIDRINRSSQGFTTLDERILKLKGMTEPFLWDKNRGLSRRVVGAIQRELEVSGFGVDGINRVAPVFVLGDEAVDWVTGYQRISEAVDYDPASPTEVRWKQFGHLIRLFHAHGLFLEEEVPISRLAFQEVAQG